MRLHTGLFILLFIFTGIGLQAARYKHYDTVYAIAGHGDTFYTASADGSILEWHKDKPYAQRRLARNYGILYALAVSDNGLLATGGKSGRLRFITAQTGDNAEKAPAGFKLSSLGTCGPKPVIKEILFRKKADIKRFIVYADTCSAAFSEKGLLQWVKANPDSLTFHDAVRIGNSLYNRVVVTGYTGESAVPSARLLRQHIFSGDFADDVIHHRRRGNLVRNSRQIYLIENDAMLDARLTSFTDSGPRSVVLKNTSTAEVYDAYRIGKDSLLVAFGFPYEVRIINLDGSGESIQLSQKAMSLYRLSDSVFIVGGRYGLLAEIDIQQKKIKKVRSKPVKPR